MSNEAFRYVRRLLPGPYTMVLRATSDVPRAMKNRDHEVGMRFPAHPVCTMLVELLGEPLLTGSVSNGDEQPELEEPELLERGLPPEVEIVVDVGPLWPDPSTVLRFTENEIEVLREGQGPLPDWAA
jgi:tRNA threonylcarbamoyl adenosine modification protein (Sua5/YciO/YrdC/YwlC family)